MGNRFLMMIGVAVAAVATVQLSFAEEKQTMKAANANVVMETSEGSIMIELWADKAPETVKNFLRYADEKFYDNTIFHRVIKGFMIQGGGLNPDMVKKETDKPITNEAGVNSLSNIAGTIAMARTPNPHSATSQFFINVKDNLFLDYKQKSPRGWGYCVFGRVIKGMDVVRTIENVPTGIKEGRRDVPLTPVIIESVEIVSK